MKQPTGAEEAGNLMRRRDRLPAWVDRTGGTPAVTAVALALTLILGVLANKYTDQILISLTLRGWSIGGDPLWGAITFYVIGGLVVVFTVTAQLAEGRVRRRTDTRRAEAEARLIEQTEQLRSLVQTLPPPTFLTSFARTDEACRRVLVDTIEELHAGDLSVEEARVAIRTVLGAIANLVQTFENAPPETLYGANIMLYRPAPLLRDLPVDQRARWEDGLTFAGGVKALEGLDGVLQLIPALSTTTRRRHNEPDDTLVPLLLPVPTERRVRVGEQQQWRVLPGAPLAWVRRRWVAYPTQERVLTWCRRRGAFSGVILGELERYFAGPGSAVQGFASLPFPGGTNAAPVGVLNVHCNQPGLLAQRQPAKHLFPLLHPILGVIAELTKVLLEAEREEQAVPAEGGGRIGRSTP